MNPASLPDWWIGWAVAITAVPALLLPVLSSLLDRSGHIRLRHWAEGAGGRLRDLYARPDRFEAFRFLLAALGRAASLGLFACTWILLERLEAPSAGTIAFGLSFGVVLVLEWLVRWLVEVHSEATLHRLTFLYRFADAALLPAVWILAGHIAHEDPEDDDWDDEEEVSEDEIKAFIDVGRREGILEPEEEELVRSIVDFGDTRVRSVMTPRVEVVAADLELPTDELAEVFFESKHARVPLYRGSIDQIVGILHIRDLFAATARGEGCVPEDLAKPPYFVPESKSLPQLLQELQALHQQMAIVVDEYGGVAGLVTVEDLVEEIVGDIADEHEEEVLQRERLPDGSWRLPGRTDLEEVEELFEVDLDAVEWETVSGMICGEMGHVPTAGDVVVLHGLRLAVEEADDRRVTTVAVRRLAEGETVHRVSGGLEPAVADRGAPSAEGGAA